MKIFICLLIAGAFAAPQHSEEQKQTSKPGSSETPEVSNEVPISNVGNIDVPELSSEIEQEPEIVIEEPHESHSSESHWKTLDGNPPDLMAHRGSKAFLPEHTLGAYELAAILGADYVEPDLVLTQDGQFVCYHDLTLGQGTDVATKEKFAHLKTDWTFMENGKEVEIKDEWFIFNFTLDEIKELNVKQKNVGIRPQYYNHLFEIPTFKEYLDLVNRMTYKLNRTIGIIPEIKKPKFHNEILKRGDHYMEDLLIQEIKAQGYPIKSTQATTCHYKENNEEVEVPCGLAILQSFERESLKYLKTLTDLDLLLLVDANVGDLTNKGIEEVAEYAKHVHVLKEFLYSGVKKVIDALPDEYRYNKTEVEEMGGFAEDIITKVHKAGMKIGLFTIYDSREPSYMGCAVKCEEENLRRELFFYFEHGVDGLFVENMMEAREMMMHFNQTLYEDENGNGDEYSVGTTTTALKVNAAIGCLLPLTFYFYSYN